MEVSGQLHAPAALHPGKEPLVPTEKMATWAPEPMWTRGRSEKSVRKINYYYYYYI